MVAKILNKCQARIGICLENRMERPKEEKENEKEYLALSQTEMIVLSG